MKFRMTGTEHHVQLELTPKYVPVHSSFYTDLSNAWNFLIQDTKIKYFLNFSIFNYGKSNKTNSNTKWKVMPEALKKHISRKIRREV